MKEKEMRRRPNQTEKTRRKIVEAIHVSMKEADLSDITIRSVCKKAGVSIGTFYLYFSCKEAALLYGYRQADEQFLALPLEEDAWGSIRKIMTCYLKMVTLETCMPCARFISAISNTTIPISLMNSVRFFSCWRQRLESWFQRLQ